MISTRSARAPGALHFILLLGVGAAACATATTGEESTPSFVGLARRDDAESAVPNDNRRSAGLRRGDTLHVALVARTARWRPDLDVDSTVTVQAFAAEDGVARIPGPFIRAPQGTALSVRITNSLADSALIMYGLRAGTAGPNDTIQVAPGATRTIAFTASRSGTYMYWGSRSGRPINQRWGRDGQMTGAIVIDPVGDRPDPRERIFVITLVDFDPAVAAPNRVPTNENIWEIAVNGRSWPHTERLRYDVGDTIRWRWINGTNRIHPMHLHGFHFRVTAGGAWWSDTAYARGSQPEFVTRSVLAGQTFAMEWVPTRRGHWLMHCHMGAHMSPYPERSPADRAHDSHDAMRHATASMAGLVIGIRIDGRDRTTDAAGITTRKLRLLVGEHRGEPGQSVARGFVLQQAADPAPDSVEVPGTPLILRRGERAEITVVNRMATATSVHWHGMELDGRFDGVAGWSGSGRRRAPLIMPRDSFTVAFIPPRAGTYIYHAHMEEEPQLISGVYGPMLVLEPGDTFDAARDRIFTLGGSVHEGKPHPSINGSRAPEPIDMTVGVTYRLRVININPNEPVTVTLSSGSSPVQWRMVAKDGAVLPAALQREVPAPIRIGVGETYDFQWTPTEPGDRTMLVVIGTALGPGETLRQVFRVR